MYLPYKHHIYDHRLSDTKSMYMGYVILTNGFNQSYWFYFKGVIPKEELPCAFMTSQSRDGKSFTKTLTRSRAWNNERSVEILEKHLSINKLVPPPSLTRHINKYLIQTILKKLFVLNCWIKFFLFVQRKVQHGRLWRSFEKITTLQKSSRQVLNQSCYPSHTE